MKSVLVTLCLSYSFLTIQAQSDSTKKYTTVRIAGDAPTIDGSIDDAAWSQVEWAGGDFRQNNPDAGKPATVQTKFKILYDEKNLYVAFKNYDPEPNKIVSRMSRRDGFEGDMVEINIDSYYDKRTAFSFTCSVSGVKGEEYVSNNGDSWDASWDPIWYMKTSIDAEGWNAEARIPLSQLRFADKPDLVWGIQVTRIFFRNQERSCWQYIPPDAAGWVHLFGELHGIKGVKPQKQLEIQPYVVAKTESFEREEGNPYVTGSSSAVDYGIDAKIGITSDITLDVTVNPDFGQVEADPSQVNLSAFELFFQERRPFFIEGNNILNFPISNMSENNLFYSRRIGRSPQVSVDPDENGDDDVNEYVKPNNSTTILGAAKITGKNKNGFSWGVLETVTERERTEIDSLGYKRDLTTEPMTNYFVARAQQDIDKGNTVVGGMATATNRKLDESRLRHLHSGAYSAGLDVLHHWKERTYYVSGRGIVSHVKGSTDAITQTQLSSRRFFQRSDNHHKDIDYNRTSLTGTGGQFMIGKKSGDIVGDIGILWQSPELELNDIGFLAQTDNIMQWSWIQYRILKPRGIARSERYNLNQWQEYDFGMRNLSEGYNFNAHFELKNFWRTGGGIGLDAREASNADLRGGPAIRYPGSYFYWAYVGTDARKKLYMMINNEMSFGWSNYTTNAFYSIDLVYKPINALNLSISPSLSKNRTALQYVSTTVHGENDRYVLGEIDQTTMRVVIRATYMITPNLSVQYYGQPFGTAGQYNNYKYVTASRAPSYDGRFTMLNSQSLLANGSIIDVDEDLDGNADYSFDKPDFNFGQFRSNFVVRWEYIPGSTVFLVWTQERNGAFYDEEDNEHSRYSLHFPDKGHNIFLFKFTYRFVL
ncbi:MAG TPA: DUF5916 domain-containing protein [Chryseosolibacter sp.]|nr:DUF5916 domain-containing protein [Chryseosolibacter sp.]